ncbi:hypothetical protein BESB_010840 [Besnoitia besnoiti]|uniref:Cilia- and flagella-associated protein 206 n=1 Tax=Besnoitia besnoiti TaxID=94643 RepID=A0A2A9MR28_BESBE|nr:hypothetical protein BESB_010840 [Besnoitia besnoiti]PFH38742.1 hypothetical protein BESB_010840 [Besnoitia besnoiti]
MPDSQWEETLVTATRRLIVQLRQTGHPVPEVYAAYCLCATRDDEHDFLINKLICIEDEGEIGVQRAADRILQERGPEIACLKLQAMHEATLADEKRLLLRFEDRTANEIANENSSTLFSCLTVPYEKIVGLSHAVLKDADRMKALYKKVLHLCVTRFRRAPWLEGGESQDEVIEDTRAALESAFPITGLRSLFGLPLVDRRRYLEELCFIILGIRVFNSQTGRATSASVPDPRNLLASHSPDILQSLERDIEEGQGLTDEFARILVRPPPEVSREKDWKDIADDHIYLAQLVAYKRALLTALFETRHQLKEAVSECISEILRIREELGGKQCASRDDVFPMFSRLGITYETAFLNHRKLCSLERLVTSLAKLGAEYVSPPASTFRVTSNCLDAGSSDSSGSGLAADTAACATEANEQQAEEDAIEEVARVADRESGGLLELGGRCAWCLAKYGALVPANLAIRTASHDGHAYAFSTIEGAKEFAQDPAGFVLEIQLRLKRQPALIHLLDLDRFYPRTSLRNILKLQKRSTEKFCERETVRLGGDGTAVDQLPFLLQEPRNADAAVMTPVHFETIQKDTSYHWNEWDLRRRALAMADLMDKATRSSQTTVSHCRREQEAQVYLLKEKAQNTMKCKGTAAIRGKKYIAGLRGKAERQPHTVRIELDL